MRRRCRARTRPLPMLRQGQSDSAGRHPRSAAWHKNRTTKSETRERDRLRGAILAVGQHLLDAGYAGRADRRHLFELAHAPGGLEAGKVALGGMAAQNLAAGGYFEALAHAAVRLQLHLGFRSEEHTSELRHQIIS